MAHNLTTHCVSLQSHDTQAFHSPGTCSKLSYTFSLLTMYLGPWNTILTLTRYLLKAIIRILSTNYVSRSMIHNLDTHHASINSRYDTQSHKSLCICSRPLYRISSLIKYPLKVMINNLTAHFISVQCKAHFISVQCKAMIRNFSTYHIQLLNIKPF